MSALAAARAIHFAACIQAVGGLLFLGIVARLPANESRRWLWTTTLIAALATPPSGLVWLTLQAADMTDSGALEAWAGGAVATLMWQSQAGVVWWVRAVLAAALAAVTLILALVQRPPARWSVYWAFALAAALFMSCAWLSHAASDPSPYRPLHLAVHSVHMLGAALWFGGLLPLAMLLKQVGRDPTPADFAVAHDIARRFSAVALVAVGLIVVTGIANLMLLVGGVAVADRFVQVLALKLALFLAMLVLATINRQVLLPRLAVADSVCAIVLLRRSVWAETVLAALVLLVVGELGITAPIPDE